MSGRCCRCTCAPTFTEGWFQMRRRTSLIALLLVAGAAFSLTSTALAQQAPQKKGETTAGSKSRGAATTDENIKKPRAANDPAAAMVPAPATKGGAGTR